MSNRKDLPFLLALLDDSSRMVRDHVREVLLNYGASLEVEAAPYLADLNEIQQEELEKICSQIFESSFSSGWTGWLDMQNSKASLECALVHLSQIAFGQEAYEISDDLDTLARLFEEESGGGNVEDLMRFLFQEMGFTSPLEEAHSHLHDNLAYVLKERQGSQIALSCIAILVGYRVGLDLHGISIQGNFIAISFEDQQLQMYNSFNQGKPLARASVIYIEEAFRRNQTAPHDMKAEVHEIVMQILKRTIDAHHRDGNEAEAKQYVEIYKSLLDELRQRGKLGC